MKIYEVFAQIKDNRANLVRGTVLDPDNHPSYSDERKAEIALVRARQAELKAELKTLS